MMDGEACFFLEVLGVAASCLLFLGLLHLFLVLLVFSTAGGGQEVSRDGVEGWEPAGILGSLFLESSCASGRSCCFENHQVIFFRESQLFLLGTTYFLGLFLKLESE